MRVPNVYSLSLRFPSTTPVGRASRLSRLRSRSTSRRDSGPELRRVRHVGSGLGARPVRTLSVGRLSDLRIAPPTSGVVTSAALSDAPELLNGTGRLEAAAVMMSHGQSAALAVAVLSAAVAFRSAAAQGSHTTQEAFDAMRRDAATQSIASQTEFHSRAARYGMALDGTQRLLKDAGGATGAAFSPGLPSRPEAVTRVWFYPRPHAPIAAPILAALLTQAAEFYVEDSGTVRLYLRRSPFTQCEVVDGYVLQMATGSVVEFDSTVTCPEK